MNYELKKMIYYCFHLLTKTLSREKYARYWIRLKGWCVGLRVPRTLWRESCKVLRIHVKASLHGCLERKYSWKNLFGCIFHIHASYEKRIKLQDKSSKRDFYCNHKSEVQRTFDTMKNLFVIREYEIVELWIKSQLELGSKL